VLPTGSKNHALEDSPPANWTVSSISNSGTWDAANRKVKWGPFFDTTARTLTYNATPPAGTTGAKTFNGVISIDGVPQAICGSSTISGATYHPADTSSNWRIDINEATAYGAAWKRGDTWSRAPNPIPIDYVTNAGFLWKSGEAYHYDATKTPPFATGAPPVAPSQGEWALGDGRSMLAGNANSTFGATSYSPGSALQIRISVSPDQTTFVYAVEDTPPSGWTVSAIDNGGSWDATNGTVKWGPFFDNQSRTLGYKATPPAGTSCARVFSGVASFDGTSVLIGGQRSIPAAGGACTRKYWIPVAAHQGGSGGSQWRTDLGLLSLGSGSASIQLKLHTGSKPTRNATVPASAQSILTDVVNLFGIDGQGALEISSNQLLGISSRTYNAGTAGTTGQSYDGFTTEDGVAAGQSVYLPQLTENATYRSNILVANTGTINAAVKVELYNSAGAKVGEYTLSLSPGQSNNSSRPFNKAGQSNLAAGYAKVTVTSGFGVIAYASVLDNNVNSNDPTSVLMKRLPPAGQLKSWLPVAIHAPGSLSTQWRTDIGILNLNGNTANLQLKLHTATGPITRTRTVAAHNQSILVDGAALFGSNVQGAVEIDSDQPIIVTSRTYNQTPSNGTFGQDYDSAVPSDGLSLGQSAYLTQMTENDRYRSNILVANIGSGNATALVDLYAGNGSKVGSYTLTLAPGRSDNRRAFNKAGQTNLASGYAKVTVQSGNGIIASASVIDNTSSDPTTIPMKR
jgi:hypothetical protein